jgi:hypothetical protein
MMFEETTPLCQTLSACAQLTTEQSNELLLREWNIHSQPFFTAKVMSTTQNNVCLFAGGELTLNVNLQTLLKRVTELACELAIKWRKRAEEGTPGIFFNQLTGSTFRLHEDQHFYNNAWIFRHSHDLGFLIVPMLVVVQPAMVMVDLVVPIGATVTECCGVPLELRFFPRVIVHNVLQQLLDVQPELLPDIIGMQHRVKHNTLVHQLLHAPTWENIIRVAVVAVQQLADTRISLPRSCPSSPPVEPINVVDLIEPIDKRFCCIRHIYPELFCFIKFGQVPSSKHPHPSDTFFTPEDIYDCVEKVVQPLTSYTQLALDVPDVPMSKVANAAMHNFFFTEPSPTSTMLMETSDQTFDLLIDP